MQIGIYSPLANVTSVSRVCLRRNATQGLNQNLQNFRMGVEFHSVHSIIWGILIQTIHHVIY